MRKINNPAVEAGNDHHKNYRDNKILYIPYNLSPIPVLKESSQVEAKR